MRREKRAASGRKESVMNKLKKYRRMVGLTQHALSRLTGIPLGRLVYAETGRLKLTDEEIQLIKSAIRQRNMEVTAELFTRQDAWT
jgi:DNA-binding XRE family transcriptional regulator